MPLIERRVHNKAPYRFYTNTNSKYSLGHQHMIYIYVVHLLFALVSNILKLNTTLKFKSMQF